LQAAQKSEVLEMGRCGGGCRISDNRRGRGAAQKQSPSGGSGRSAAVRGAAAGRRKNESGAHGNQASAPRGSNAMRRWGSLALAIMLAMPAWGFTSAKLDVNTE